MAFIEERHSRYRARYGDPLGQRRSESFTRKPDAERFLREVQVEIERGRRRHRGRTSPGAPNRVIDYAATVTVRS